MLLFAQLQRRHKYILDLLQKETDSQRLLAMMMLMTAMTASRAQLVSDGRELPNTHEQYIETLTDMLTGVLLGPNN